MIQTNLSQKEIQMELDLRQRFNQLYAHSSGHTLKTIVINVIQTDGASELVEGDPRRWCEENQIAIQISAPGVAQENGIAEKSVHLVKKMAQTIHKSAGFPPHFWLLSMNLASHILMFSTPRLFGGSVTCYERMFGRKPDVSHLRVPGCLVYYYAYQIKKKVFLMTKPIRVYWLDTARAPARISSITGSPTESSGLPKLSSMKRVFLCLPPTMRYLALRRRLSISFCQLIFNGDKRTGILSIW